MCSEFSKKYYYYFLFKDIRNHVNNYLLDYDIDKEKGEEVKDHNHRLNILKLNIDHMLNKDFHVDSLSLDNFKE